MKLREPVEIDDFLLPHIYTIIFVIISDGETWLLTVAGPMMVTPFSSAILIIFLVCASGMPSAMMAMVWI